MSKRVLLVDDDPRFLDGLRRTLRNGESDWEILTACSAEEALSTLRTTSCDVVVSDIAMPQKDGFALLAELKASEQTRDVPVIMLTGVDDVGGKRRALELGALDLLSKPVHSQDLLARLGNALRLKEYEDLLRDQNATLERMVAQRTEEVTTSRLDIIWKLAKAGEYRDEQTGNHVVRVGCYCRILAQALGLPRDQVEALFLASPLHDIGKIGVPDEILRKSGPLDSEEWEIMKGHCRIGARILGDDSKIMRAYLTLYDFKSVAPSVQGQNAILRLASSIAMSHHEWWDGGGYPNGFSGERIPQTSRIVALADTYDALRTSRPYKPELPEVRAVEIIREERGTHFEPAVADAFEHVVPIFAAIHEQFADSIIEMAETEGAL